jgi:putative FmdB family regulatory protein
MPVVLPGVFDPDKKSTPVPTGLFQLVGGYHMPIYEYYCTDCSNEFETMQKFSDPPVEHCPSCSGKVHKLISRSAFHLKGSGWYVTDYARKGNQNGKSNTSSSTDTPSDTSASTAADKNAASKDTASQDTASKDTTKASTAAA